MRDEEFDALAEDLRKMELDASLISLERVKIVYRRSLAQDQGVNPIPLLDEFIGRVIDELQDRLFLSFEPSKAHFYSDAALFGNEVENAFPSASPEIIEAGKCFALDRWSATVFHLMRTLEVGIRCLAAVFHVDAFNNNWQNVLEQIQKNVNAMNSVSHGADWKADRQFYSEAVSHFLILKNAWRNYTMHLHERYDEERATIIFDSVRAFMRQLAKKLKE